MTNFEYEFQRSLVYPLGASQPVVIVEQKPVIRPRKRPRGHPRDGFSLSADGTLTAAPTQPGEYAFEVQLADVNGNPIGAPQTSKVLAVNKDADFTYTWTARDTAARVFPVAAPASSMSCTYSPTTLDAFATEPDIRPPDIGSIRSLDDIDGLG